MVVRGDAAASLAEEGAATDIQQTESDREVGFPGLLCKALVDGGTATNKFQNAIRAMAIATGRHGKQLKKLHSISGICLWQCENGEILIEIDFGERLTGCVIQCNLNRVW